MTDYISREAAIKEFCDDCMDKEWCKSNGESCSRIKNINAVPAADVVEVVRCKDCKYYNDGKLLGPSKFCYYYHIGTGLNTADDDFCSHGERRVDNG